MKNFPKYGKIQNMYKVNDLLGRRIVITEKLHGTNARFMWSEKDGGFVLGTRNNISYRDGVRNEYDGYNLTDWVMNNVAEEKIAMFEGYVFYGEFHGGGIQKGMTYTQDKQKDFRVFDIRNPEGDFINWDEVVEICEKTGLRTVPVVGSGLFTRAQIEEFINVISQTAIDNGVEIENNFAEGVVIKPLQMQRDQHGEWLRSKLKGAKWAENASVPKIPKPLKPEQIELNEKAAEFALAVVTSGRVATVVEHITREGNTKVDMSRTPDFLKELSADIWLENEEMKAMPKNEFKIYNKAISGQGMKLWKEYVQENYNG